MHDYITLMGAEDVRNAGHAMVGAAATMRNAASEFDDAASRQKMAMEDFIFQFNAALDRMAVILETNGKSKDGP